MMYSVVKTAKESGLSSYHYLRCLFETLPNMNVTNKGEIDKVLPWSADVPFIGKAPIKGKQTKNSPKNTIVIVYLGLFDVLLLYHFKNQSLLIKYVPICIQSNYIKISYMLIVQRHA